MLVELVLDKFWNTTNRRSYDWEAAVGGLENGVGAVLLLLKGRARYRMLL